MSEPVNPASEPDADNGQREEKPDDVATERASWGDPLSAMAPRFNWPFRLFARRFFRHFELDPETVRTLRSLESRGAVVYVMRYSSRLDYLLFNTLFLREGLRLSSFANGIRFHYYRPFFEMLRISLRNLRMRSRKEARRDDREYTRHLSLGGQSLFIFLRTERFRGLRRGRRHAKKQHELDLLKEVVGAAWDTDRPVYFVPLSLFWRKGPRTESRFLNLTYGATTRPSDLSKVGSFLANYRSLTAKVGESIDLQGFISGHRKDGASLVARKVRRSILIYLYREEKVVEGPTLRPPYRVQRELLEDPRVQAAIQARAAEKKWPEERARYQAEKMFREIAANMNSTFLAVLNWIVSGIFRRMFASIEVDGLERVADSVRRHPVVLVPSHRSYFDFLILSVLLYSNFMTPPHIAARENMAFGPFGYIFRRAGAFFLRRSFADPLYKEVFRAYVGYLVREGFVQEFFIEGGRSRTGKTLAPRLGMLSWDIEAFVDSHQRDLAFIPVSITYERLVEESLMVDELKGGDRTEESVLGLMRARKYLQRRFGTAHVHFGEPIWLAEALGDRRELFRKLDRDELPESEVEEAAAAKRKLIEETGWKIVEKINWNAVANATSVASAVLMAASHRGLRREDLVLRMQQVVDLLRLQKVQLTPALESDEGLFEESIQFLLRSDLIRASQDAQGEILFFEEPKRQALDLYRNAIAHFLAAPSFMARRLLRGATVEELRDDLGQWLDLFYQEFVSPRDAVMTAHCEAILAHFESSGWVEERDGRRAATAEGARVFRYLAELTRSEIDVYRAACAVVDTIDDVVTSSEFRKRVAEQFACDRLLGEARREEAASDSTYSNALDLLVTRGVLEVGSREVKSKRGSRVERIFSVREDTQACSALSALRATLALADLD